MSQLLLDLQPSDIVNDMTINQRLDTALHPVTTKHQAIEGIENGQVTYYLCDSERYTFTAILGITGLDNDELELSEIYFEDQSFAATDAQIERINYLATDSYRCLYDNDDGYETEHGLRNSDFIYGYSA